MNKNEERAKRILSLEKFRSLTQTYMRRVEKWTEYKYWPWPPEVRERMTEFIDEELRR